MDDFALSTIIPAIWKAMTGGYGGTDFLEVFTQAAGVFAVFTWLVMFASEALDIAAGRGFKLDRKLVVYAFLGMLIWIWPTVAHRSYYAAAAMANEFIGDTDTVLDNFLGAYEQMQQVDTRQVESMGTMERIAQSISRLPTLFVTGLLNVLGLLIILGCYILILIMVAGMFGTFGMTLLLGPVFLALGISEHFRQYTWRWFGSLLTYMLAIPLYGAALQAAIAIYGASMINPSQLQGGVNMDHVFITAVGPLVSLGIIFAVSKVVSGLTGGVMASSGSLAMSIGMGAAGLAARGMGGGKGAGSVAGAAGGAAVSAAKSGASSSIKAATE